MKHAKTSRIASLLALVLAVTMLLTLVGCGNDSGDTDGGSTTTTTTTTTASGDTTTTEGDATTTEGDATTTEGDATTTEGDATTTEGDATTTEGDATTTEGDATTTEGDATTTEGDAPDATTTKKPTEADKTTTKKPTEADKTTTTKKPTEADKTTTKNPFGGGNKKTTASKVTTTTTKKEISTDIFKQVPKELSGQKIKMMIWWNQATDDTKEAETFKKETGIQVVYETSVMDKYQSTLAAKLNAGGAPALAAIINEWYPAPITRGLMQPIKNTGWDYTDPIYATAMMDQFSYKGEHYGIALKGSNMTTFEVMFFNKDILKQKGVSEDPYELWKKGQWNWTTCLDIAKKCTNASKNEYGLTTIYQNYWMLSSGQDFVLSDINGLKNNIKSSKVLDAWGWAWDMIYTHKVIPTNFSNQQQLFYNGSVAMMGGGSYFMQAEASHTNYVPQNCKFDWGVVPFPSPKGQSAVAACEGTVWGFPTKIKGDQLQAAMWFLRYYLDDYTYSARDFYPSEECWEVMKWMWDQKIQSFNSVGVVTYGGKYNAATIQYSLIDEATTKAQVKTNLDAWYAEIDANINAINTEME